jgi:ABC-type phosphate transport system substrate-binding protein
MIKTYLNVFSVIGGLILFAAAGEARAQVVVIINPANTAKIDLQYVKNIFLGKVRVFPEGLVAKPVDIIEGSDLRNVFYSSVFGKSEMDMKLFWSTAIFTGAGTPPKALESERDVLKYVSENPAGIGYVSSGKADKSVKILLSLE